MKSKDKIEVLVERIPAYGDKLLMKIKIKRSDGVFIPSFED